MVIAGGSTVKKGQQNMRNLGAFGRQLGLDFPGAELEESADFGGGGAKMTKGNSLRGRAMNAPTMAFSKPESANQVMRENSDKEGKKDQGAAN